MLHKNYIRNTNCINERRISHASYNDIPGTEIKIIAMLLGRLAVTLDTGYYIRGYMIQQQT